MSRAVALQSNTRICYYNQLTSEYLRILELIIHVSCQAFISMNSVQQARVSQLYKETLAL